MREIYYSDPLVTLYRGEALDVLRELPSESASLLLTDPPYSSGGMFRGDRMVAPGAKYQSTNAGRRFADFAGDNRDQRSYEYWSALWLSECLRIVEPGALCLVFTDWRQQPTTTDAVQAGDGYGEGSSPGTSEPDGPGGEASAPRPSSSSGALVEPCGTTTTSTCRA